ncbi:amidase [Rufibacter sp. DG15C]|uniref:amidase n=1 Tax=Rufibacter sp. DG15C TaxID=1379909 RepID=UPI00078E6199|nr:amidase [Rufibacter sp. DG15C]AMM52927.1 amidase [Rufibacter sp. DG15C]
MKRRNFLKAGSLAGITFSMLGVGACTQTKDKTTATTDKDGNSPSDEFELSEATVQQLQDRMKSGDLTSKRITQLYLDRIEAIDKNGPKLNSVIEINPDALQIAEAMDQERKNGKVRGPLHGIPVLIKDNIDTRDKMSTSAGALALAENKARKDAFVAAKLREAGAVILGKTNLSEWANFRSTRSTSGWSSRGGQTKNPYVLDRSPCGSSSGSGTAVAANLCAVAVGTETDGSVVCPASVNGAVGIKPTVGLVSRAGIIPISASQDTAGPIARTVADAAILLGALTGQDSNDPVTQEGAGKALSDYTKFLDANSLQGKRIGIEKSFLKGHEGIDELYKKAIEVLKSKGATVVEVEIAAKIGELGGDEFKVLQYEFKDGVNKYLATANAKVKSLKDVIEFNKQNAAKAMPYFKQEILEESEKLGDLKSKEYVKVHDKNLKTSRALINKIMDDNTLDAISGPTYGPSWCIDVVNGDAFSGYGLSTPAAISGYPHITVPMGLVHHLPIGFSFFGKPYTEGPLIALAYAFEQATKARQKPTFLHSTNPA